MQNYEKVIEYFDELYPIDEPIQKFVSKFIEKYPKPVKFLGVGSQTGSLEFYLAKQGCDVTGIEVIQPLLNSSLLKRRTQLLAIRFFNLSTEEMTKFLGKKFYNVLYCINNRLCHLQTEEAVKKFFADAKLLLAEGGTLAIATLNLDLAKPNSTYNYKNRSSIRATLKNFVTKQEDKPFLSIHLEHGNNNTSKIIDNLPIYNLTKEKIEEFAKAAGFKKIEFYSSFEFEPFEQNSEHLIALIK